MNASALMGMRRAMLILAAMLALLMLVGCGGGWGDLRPTVAIAQGSSQTVVVGQPVTFTAVTTGTGPFTYQWYLNGKSVSGATASTYAISETTSAMNGSVYTVTATNAAGTASSQGCTLTVNTPPAITNPPSNQTVYVGQAGSFSVTATGTSPLSYQWYLNGSAISGATSSSYTTPATTTIGDSSSYTVKVTNSAGSATSSAATLTVLPLVPTLAFAPIPVETYGNPPFTVSASSASSGAITYSLVSGPATVSNTGTVVITGTGSVFISASQAASGNYTTATATTSFVVDAEAQTINFANPGIQTVASPLTLSATSTSGLPVTLSSSTPSVCTVSGATVALIASGICTIDANQAGNTDYAPATMVPQSFTVNGEAQTITFANPGSPNCRYSAYTLRNLHQWSHGYVYLYDPKRVHGVGHNRDVPERRNLHHRRQSGRQQHLRRSPHGSAELHGERRSPDHHLRQSWNPDRRYSAHALRNLHQWSHGYVYLYDPKRVHRVGHNRDFPDLRNLHHRRQSGRQQHLRRSPHGSAELHGERLKPRPSPSPILEPRPSPLRSHSPQPPPVVSRLRLPLRPQACAPCRAQPRLS